MATKECPTCDGWGFVIHERDTFGPSGHGNRSERQECPTCNGRGEVPEDDEDERDTFGPSGNSNQRYVWMFKDSYDEDDE